MFSLRGDDALRPRASPGFNACRTSNTRTNGSSHPTAKRHGFVGSKAMSEVEPWTLRSTTTARRPRRWRRGRRTLSAALMGDEEDVGVAGGKRTFMPMPVFSMRGGVSTFRRERGNARWVSRRPSETHRLRLRGASDLTPRSRSTRRTSPSPAVVTHRALPLCGTNSLLKMLLT